MDFYIFNVNGSITMLSGCETHSGDLLLDSSWSESGRASHRRHQVLHKQSPVEEQPVRQNLYGTPCADTRVSSVLWDSYKERRRSWIRLSKRKVL